MINANSNPVRTPSYHIGIYGRYNVGSEINPRKYQYVEATLIHHSNGQDGETYINSPAGRTLNLVNGTFSTNYTDLSYGQMSKFLGKSNVYLLQKYSLQIHHTIPGGFDDGVAENYGLYRLKGNVSALFNGQMKTEIDDSTSFASYEYMRISLDFMVNVGRMDYIGSRVFDPRRVNAELSIKGLGRWWGSFVHPFVTIAWIGQDQYNIYYEQNYWLGRVGFATDVNRLFALRNKVYPLAYPFDRYDK